MSSTTAPNLTQDTSSFYDPDEVVPRNSPILAPYKPKLEPSPSPPPSVYWSRVSRPSTSGRRKSARPKVKPTQGDAVLVSLLDGGRRPEIAILAGAQTLPSASDEEDSDDSSDSDSYDDDSSAQLSVAEPMEIATVQSDTPEKAAKSREGQLTMANGPPNQTDAGAIDLMSLAASALAVKETAKPPTPPSATDFDCVKERPRPVPLSGPLVISRDHYHPDDRPMVNPSPSPYSPHSVYSPKSSSHLTQKIDIRSPTTLPPPSGVGELPPIQMNSPRSETNGQTPLPSISAALGDLSHITEAAMDGDGGFRHGSYTHSPPGALPRLPSMQMHHGSPPISPAEMYRRELPSPGHPLPPALTSPHHYYYQTNGMHRPNPEYSSSNTETPSTDHSGSTPATSTSIADRMSIDGLNNPPGAFLCKFTGCNAPPFQTQYLLNSHANVHSSARPHYCPVKGCPRSEGGKGFKRKNEMIRHGLVHDSPGYVCPFCPDREHKYPRPDNLQRHVRVHHVDKDKDDIMLRDVLAQRPDGPNRGRRRRHGPGT